MKFASIYLSNYIGIYNGMGLYEIHIDMTKCRNRITIIRGDNGSGKSTLTKAMTLFPDPNDSFIPGLPARKEIVLLDGETIYKLSFVHGVKASGERDVTKAYITKTFGDQIVELNENGNVSSFKDILFSELGLDANFIALSQLSTDDRGLADKKPAERKKFVNSIISSLDTYNAIYKTLSKRSLSFKSMINSIAAKLNMLGDEASMASELESIEARINTLQNNKDIAVTKLAKEQSTVALLDPDGSIQNINTTVKAEMELAEKDSAKIQSVIDGLVSSNGINLSTMDRDFKNIIDNKNSLIIKNQIARNDIESLMTQKEIEADELSKKIQKLSSIQSGYNYETLKSKIEEYKKELDSIAESLHEIGIDDASKLTKEEYILALETLKDLDEYISSFKSATDFEITQTIIKTYIKTGELPERENIKIYREFIDNYNERISGYKQEISDIKSKMNLMDIFNLRPDNCTNDTCPFIKEALEFSKNRPEKRLEFLEAEIYEMEREIEVNKKTEDQLNGYNDAVNRFAAIVREVDKNGAILSKMPNGEMFKDKAVFFDRLLSGYSFEYMKSIYQYIDMANLFDVYKQTMEIYNQYRDELKVYESKAEIIDSLSEDIDRINKAINSIVDKIEPIQQEIYEREIKIAQLQEREGIYDAIVKQQVEQEPYFKTIADCRAKLMDNNRKMNDISAALVRANTAKEEISQISFALEPLMAERDKLHHSVQMMRDYVKERDELQANYDFIETIKYYSSPTTGIQLVFMELYMGKIIALANELLSLLFKGQFVIQPFVINDTEFRIPCLGEGYLNDDISSMSSSQICMISMILSFALLHHSSTKYNIIKLDEIDGPLDYNNRIYFMDVLNSIMDIMGTEQCIMISHNSELQINNSDVILLRHDESNADYNQGNIIWRYQ